MPDLIFAFGAVRDNAQRIIDCRTLGYLSHDQRILDPTWGEGKFWTKWDPLPPRLVACDLNPAKSPIGYPIDFTCMPFSDHEFDAITFDPPYQLNGTSTGKGSSAKDAQYGVDQYMPVAARHELIRHGMSECWRVLAPGGILLVKCQDQVASGRKHWQTDMFTAHAEKLGGRKVDELYVEGYRDQPQGTSQKHSRQDFSALLVIRKPKTRR